MNILLIDDCFEISELVKTSLAHHRVTAVDRIDSAKNTLEQSHFDLLLIDVNLPDGDGFDLLSYLEDDDYYKNVPKIILTSKDQVSYKVHGLEHGADDYITKPFHPLELKARVNLQLEKAHSSEQVIQNSFLKFDLFLANLNEHQTL